MLSRSISDNNQPSWTPLPYMADLPVGVHLFLTKVPATELGDFPESESDDE
jgi:hypothetical protein